MIKYFLAPLLSVLVLAANAQGIIAEHLRSEITASNTGAVAGTPVLSWQMAALGIGPQYRQLNQQAYRVLVSDDLALLAKNTGNIWDSKKVISNQCLQITCTGLTVLPVKTYYWKVMVWDNKGHASPWSQVANWQRGPVATEDWKGAKWIAYEALPDSLLILPGLPTRVKEEDSIKDVLPLLRKTFTVPKKIKNATLFISGLGQFCASLNGKKIGDHFLDPGWTMYDKHTLYVSFDLTNNLLPGRNTLGVMLGNGFYFIPGERYHKLDAAFGYPKMICRLALQYTDGTEENIISDTSWKAAPGPVTFSSVYGGEDYNATLEQLGWDQPRFNASKWKSAQVVNGPNNLEQQLTQPLKIFEHFTPQKVLEPKPGMWVYDLGQNASGIPYICVKGPKGSVIHITPAELLSADGLAEQKYIGSPVSFTYTLKGNGIEEWQPQFMYYGFRYLQVQGAVPPGGPNPATLPVLLAVQGLHTRNAAERTGHFTTSDTLFKKTFSLIDWAVQSNMASVFTDCPHREKLGWLEEAHLVGPSIRYNYDIETLVKKVINDINHAQTSDGLIPSIAPEYAQFEGGFRDSPEWGSSGIILPWYVWQWYGNRNVLEESYPTMARYAAYLQKKAKGHILYFGLGDWYDIGPNPPGESQLTPRGLTATAIYYYDLTILTQVARLLGKSEDAEAYSRLAAEVREAFNTTFFNAGSKQYGTGSQTANAMAVYMGLVNDGDKAAVIKNIVADIRSHHNGLTSGDIGFRYLLRVLDDAGRSDVIYDMNSRADVPGYGFQLAHGATALTESWQARPDASNNHFMLGHLMEWFYTGLAGIRPQQGAIAYHEIEIRPEIVGNITSASASYMSPYGLISSNWRKSSKGFLLTVKIPCNTLANIFVPAPPGATVLTPGIPVAETNSPKQQGYRDGHVVFRAGSGMYTFLVKSNQRHNKK